MFVRLRAPFQMVQRLFAIAESKERDVMGMAEPHRRLVIVGVHRGQLSAAVVTATALAK